MMMISCAVIFSSSLQKSDNCPTFTKRSQFNDIRATEWHCDVDGRVRHANITIGWYDDHYNYSLFFSFLAVSCCLEMIVLSLKYSCILTLTFVIMDYSFSNE